MAQEVRSAGVYLTTTSLEAAPGFAQSRHWAYVIANGLMYKWIVSDTTATNGFLVLGHTGGSAGRWHATFGDTEGTDLADADADITAAGKLIRRIPAGTLTASRTLTFEPAGVPVGAVFTIVRDDTGAFSVALVNGGPGAGTMATLVGGMPATADIGFNGSNFEVLRISSGGLLSELWVNGQRVLPYTLTSVKTTAYPAVIGDLVRCNPGGGTFNVTLPTAVGSGGLGITVKNVTASTTTIGILTTSSQTIDGAASDSIVSGYGSVTFVSDGANWMRFPAA